MKKILLLTLLLSSQAFAIDFQKVTGTFDVKEEKSESTLASDTVAQATFGTFEFKSDATRMPASVTPETEAQTFE